jgi:LmbE family N-acetylglucosaminyl deacetylase
VAEILTAVPARVLAIYAHPDDADVSAGGTLAGWAAAGAVVHVCVCAAGDKGSSDVATDPSELVERRRQEVDAAAHALGVAQVHRLDYGDGELDDAKDLRARLVALVRQIRPDAVIGPDPTAVYFGQRYVNHRDHRAVGWAILDAVAPAAGNPHYYPEAGPAHRVSVLYLSGTLDPDVWVDISPTIDRKAAAIACHASQVGEAGEWLHRAVRQRAEDAGRPASLRYAESFRQVLLD